MGGITIINTENLINLVIVSVSKYLLFSMSQVQFKCEIWRPQRNVICRKYINLLKNQNVTSLRLYNISLKEQHKTT